LLLRDAGRALHFPVQDGGRAVDDHQDDRQPTRRRLLIGATGTALLGTAAGVAAWLRGGRRTTRSPGPGPSPGREEETMTMTTTRPRRVKITDPGQTVMEGAGVRLRRIIGGRAVDYVDPFLLLDEFKSDDPNDYIAGFPWHPHRGIETVTYMLEGQVRHGDSLGNKGVIGAGDLQWMTAGHGIIHEEMPERQQGRLWGFQLWVNLPARDKMCDPRYQDYASVKIPRVELSGGGQLMLVAGEHAGTRGPVSEIAAQPLYMDVRLPPLASFSQPIPPGHSAFCYVYQGRGRFGGTPEDPGPVLEGPRLAVLDDGDHLRVSSEDQQVRFLLAAGKPLHEPVARGGPFVMNTREEIEQAYRDYRDGTFLKQQ
jgi:redox-sensitive bicupin YhaK (pirin superfamily)